MPFIPHTETDVREMLDAIGAASVDELFDEIPPDLIVQRLDVAEGVGEMEIARAMQERADANGRALCFIGAGAYEHHIPAAVWQIATRGEFYSAYTPYQAEASQGTLQLIYEFQSMMAGLTGMDVANASLYDGASALAEAVLMAARIRKKGAGARMLVPESLHPIWKRVVEAIVGNQEIALDTVPCDPDTGRLTVAALDAAVGDDTLGLVIAQPNVFGVLEDVDELTDWARQRGLAVIAAVNPVSLAVLKPPGEWGSDAAGVDIVVGEGQPLGAPLSSGGPYFGFMTTRKAHVRQMPGRIVGRATDADGRPGFVLTLQAREQHIRRSKATSNICTNQGLVVTAATIHLSLLGGEGLRSVALTSMARTRSLVAALAAEGVEAVFAAPGFHECVLDFGPNAAVILAAMEARGVLGGWPLGGWYPDRANAVLVCATETKTPDDLSRYVTVLREARAAVAA